MMHAMVVMYRPSDVVYIQRGTGSRTDPVELQMGEKEPYQINDITYVHIVDHLTSAGITLARRYLHRYIHTGTIIIICV